MHQVFEESEPDSRLLTELTPLLGLAAVNEGRVIGAPSNRLLFSGAMRSAGTAAKCSGIPALVKVS